MNSIRMLPEVVSVKCLMNNPESPQSSAQSNADQRIEELEISLAHQQRLLEQLNEVVTQQTHSLLRLEKKVPQLEREIQGLKSKTAERQGPLPDEKPPHY
ncbi:MAG: SlyX family protein [Planctomycetota bacterium]